MRATFLAVFLLGSFVGGEAQAQSASTKVTVTFNSAAPGGVTALRLDQACALDVPVIWDIVTGTATAACSDLSVWATSASTCEATPPAADAGLLGTVDGGTLVGTTTTGEIPFSITDLPGIDADFCMAKPQIDTKVYLCAGFALRDSVGTCQTTALTVNSLVNSIRVDSLPPNPPGFTAGGLNTAVTIHLSNTPKSEDYSKTLIYYQVHSSASIATDGGTDGGTSTDGGTATENVVPASVEGWLNASSQELTTVTISGLQNNVLYDFVLVAVDEAGNSSGLSVVHQATPVQSFGFYSAYRNAGGSDKGCSSSGSELAAMATLMLVMGWIFGRRR